MEHLLLLCTVFAFVGDEGEAERFVLDRRKCTVQSRRSLVFFDVSLGKPRAMQFQFCQSPAPPRLLALWTLPQAGDGDFDPKYNLAPWLWCI